MPAGTHRKGANRRISGIAARRRIGRFLARDVAEFRVKRGANRLATSPEEIAEYTGLDVETVRKHLSGIAGERQSAKVVVVRVGGTDVVVRLAGRSHTKKR